MATLSAHSRNPMSEALQTGHVLVGLCNTYPAAGIIEGMCRGWDFVWIDGQHGQMPYDAILQAVRAAQISDLMTVVRVPGHDASWIGLAADIDPDAIMVPMVNTAAEALDVARRSHFPPMGVRSYGGRRVIDRHGRDYYRLRQPLILAQIETVEAVDNAAAIIETEGIDILFFGPDDMKVSLGLPIDTNPTEHPQLWAAMRQVVAAARAAGKFAGCVAGSPASAKAAAGIGYQIIVGGGDIALLRTAAAQRLTELRAATGKTTPTPAAVRSGVYS